MKPNHLKTVLCSVLVINVNVLSISGNDSGITRLSSPIVVTDRFVFVDMSEKMYISICPIVKMVIEVVVVVVI